MEIIETILNFFRTSSSEKRFKEIIRKYNIGNSDVKYLFPVRYREIVPSLDFHRERYDSDLIFLIEDHVLPIYDEWHSEDVKLLPLLDDRYSQKKFLTIEDVNQTMADINPRNRVGGETMLNIFITKRSKNGNSYHNLDSYIVDDMFIEREMKERFGSTGVETVGNLLLFLPLHLTDETIDEIVKETGIIRWKNVLIDQERLYHYIETMVTKKDETLSDIIKSVDDAAGGIDEDFKDSITRIYECIYEDMDKGS
jgi:hypothetical protein